MGGYPLYYVVSYVWPRRDRGGHPFILSSVDKDGVPGRPPWVLNHVKRLMFDYGGLAVIDKQIVKYVRRRRGV
jgi:hypothetical protein